MSTTTVTVAEAPLAALLGKVVTVVVGESRVTGVLCDFSAANSSWITERVMAYSGPEDEVTTLVTPVITLVVGSWRVDVCGEDTLTWSAR